MSLGVLDEGRVPLLRRAAPRLSRPLDVVLASDDTVLDADRPREVSLPGQPDSARFLAVSQGGWGVRDSPCTVDFATSPARTSRGS